MVGQVRTARARARAEQSDLVVILGERLREIIAHAVHVARPLDVIANAKASAAAQHGHNGRGPEDSYGSVLQIELATGGGQAGA